MAFEYHNPTKRGVECVLRGHLGMILIPGGAFVPTPEQEQKGLTPDLLEDWVPSFLKKTPLPVRRRLLEGSGIDVPQDIVDATSHLEEFGGVVGRREQENLEELLATPETGKEPVKGQRLVPYDEASGTAEGLEIRHGGEAEEASSVQENAKEAPPVEKEAPPAPKIPEMPQIDDIGLLKSTLEKAGPDKPESFADSMQKIADAASSSQRRRRNRPSKR